MTGPQRSFELYPTKEAALAAANAGTAQKVRAIAWPMEIFSYDGAAWRTTEWRLIALPPARISNEDLERQ